MNKQINSIFLPLFFREGLGASLLFLGCLLLAACTEAEGLMERSESTVNFSLSSDASSPDVVPTRAGAVDMEVGTTVRVLAYRRPDGSGSAVLSSSNYAGEAVYKVKAGSTLELCSVTLDANGFPSVDAGATPPPLQLITGTYDFYAVTPALDVNHSGSSPTLNVRHRTDYAVSVTSKSISPTDNTVGLSTLERRCTLLSFGIDRKDGVTSVTSAVIEEAELTAMASEPMAATGIASLDVSSNANGATLTLSSSVFSVPDPVNYPYRAVGHAICLPKSEATFGLKMKVRFNGATEVTELDADNIPAMAFVEGLQYNLGIRFKERGAELVLTILPWSAKYSTPELGDGYLLQVVVGEWTELTFGTSMGNGVPVIADISGWTPLVSNVDVSGLLPLPGGMTDWHPNDINSGLGNGVNTPNDVPGWSGGGSAGGNLGGEAEADGDVSDWTGNDTSTDLGK